MSELTDDRLLPCPGCGRNVGAPHDDEGDGLYFVDCAHCGWRGPRAYNLTDAWNRWQRRAAASTSTEGAGVKALEWRVELMDPAPSAVVWWCAACPMTNLGYEVRVTNRGKTRTRMVGQDWSDFHGTVDEAKAAAQADFERRVRSCLNPPASKVTTDEAEERG